jgi:hypothetical protein
MGKADLVDAAHLALHFTYMSGREEIPEMLRLATERGARTLGVQPAPCARRRPSSLTGPRCGTPRPLIGTPTSAAAASPGGR